MEDIEKKVNERREKEEKRKEELNVNKSEENIDKSEYDLRVIETMEKACRSHTVMLSNDKLIEEVVKLDKDDNKSRFEKRQTAMKEILNNIYINKLKIEKESVKELRIEKMEYEQKLINGDKKDFIHVTFSDVEHNKIIKKNLINLDKNDNIKISDNIPVQMMDRYKIYDGIAYAIRKKGKQTRIWNGRHDFYLRVKDKDDLRLWGEIPPLITPHNMPLARVGKVSKETEVEIKDNENNRIDEIIRRNKLKEQFKDIMEMEVQREMRRIENERKRAHSDNNDERKGNKNKKGKEIDMDEDWPENE